MNIITGRTGQPHVTSQQQRDTNTAIFGNENCVLNVGKCLKAERVDTNTIRLFDGQLSIQGCIASIEANEYEDVTIENGTIGKQRYDLICAYYQKQQTDNGQYIENVNLKVIKGTEVNYLQDSSVLPIASLTADNLSIRDGAVEYDFALYQVHIQELNIVSVTPLFDVVNYDTGWIGIDYNSKFKDHVTGQKLEYRRRDKLVELRGAAQAISEIKLASANTEITIGYIPEDCAPSSIFRQPCQGSLLATWLVSVYPSGEVTAARYRTGDKLTNIPVDAMLLIHTMFFVD